jgi:hypothetical protein
MDLEIASKIVSKCRHCRKLLENYLKTTSGMNHEIASKCRHCRKLLENYSKTTSGMNHEIAGKCRHCRKLLENYSKTTSGVNLEIAKNSGMGFKAKGEAGPLIFRLEMLFSSSPGMFTWSVGSSWDRLIGLGGSAELRRPPNDTESADPDQRGRSKMGIIQSRRWSNDQYELNSALRII